MGNARICEKSFEWDMRSGMIDPKSNGMQNAVCNRTSYKISTEPFRVYCISEIDIKMLCNWFKLHIAHSGFEYFKWTFIRFLHSRFTKFVNSYPDKRSHHIGEWFKEMQQFIKLHHTSQNEYIWIYAFDIIIAAYISICIFDLYTRYGIECLCLLHRCCMLDKWIHKNQTDTQIGLSFGSTSQLTWLFFGDGLE